MEQLYSPSPPKIMFCHQAHHVLQKNVGKGLIKPKFLEIRDISVTGPTAKTNQPKKTVSSEVFSEKCGDGSIMLWTFFSSVLPALFTLKTVYKRLQIFRWNTGMCRKFHISRMTRCYSEPKELSNVWTKEEREIWEYIAGEIAICLSRNSSENNNVRQFLTAGALTRSF